ncbi:MAG: hypothetical protein L0099_17465, partial [Acidobacteria bacterium]|nr:hypothetical protein [Acidobacteriota bacterium]
MSGNEHLGVARTRAQPARPAVSGVDWEHYEITLPPQLPPGKRVAQPLAGRGTHLVVVLLDGLIYLLPGMTGFGSDG